MKKIFSKFHEKWAMEKTALFLSNIKLPENASILDLGGSDAAYMERLKRTSGKSFQIIIADIDEKSLLKSKAMGYETKYMDASSGIFPFTDRQFDCIFCNSVIEHVTVPKEEIWKTLNNFRKRSLQIQEHFASEIRRCAKSYYVQTPHRHFPIEAHTWWPFISFVPRGMQIRTIKILNKFWFKKTTPDWNLLDEHQMARFFPDAKIIVVKKMGFKKEIIALKSYSE